MADGFRRDSKLLGCHAEHRWRRRMRRVAEARQVAMRPTGIVAHVLSERDDLGRAAWHAHSHGMPHDDDARIMESAKISAQIIYRHI